MADDQDSKTEDPTGKRLGQAREQGQVGLSKDVTTFAMLAAATTVVLVILPWTTGPLMRIMHRLVEQPERIDVSGMGGIERLMSEIAGAIALAMALPMAVLATTSIIATMAQTGLLWATAKLAPNFSFLNPLNGLKRLFAPRSLIEFGKGVIKVAIIGAIAVTILKPEFMRMESMIGMSPDALLPLLRRDLQSLMMAVLSAILAIAGLDYLYQKWQTLQSLKMTKQEVKDEFKNTEGDQHIKGQQRKRRMARMRQRMMKSVPSASVVITNPTHYAVALAYQVGAAGAPVVVAKGVDHLAKRIRDLATEHDVPIVENPPLARALYATVEIEEEIPPEQYKAVAEIIGYVMRMKRMKMN